MKNCKDTTSFDAGDRRASDEDTRLGESSDGVVRSDLPIVLIVGDASRAEMHPVVAWLNGQILTAARPVFASDVASARATLELNEFPDLIVVLQGWSHEYSAADVNELFSFAPLARLVVCYGAWCESDGRNFNLWPLSVRIPVWAAISRIHAEWQLILSPGEQRPLPWSASREEVFAADRQLVLPWREPQTIHIDTPDPHFQRFLCEMLTSNRHSVVVADPTVLLFDADPWGPLRAQALQALREQYPCVEISILINQARPTDIAEFQQLGVNNFIHKLGFRSWSSSIDGRHPD